ncbi:hypothetical protein SRS16CHR_03604 [Variovorax sp. SRS16]|uniref:helix-turn-helix transcriptional regulator n=1 Tax=Variovorax sp. SRS16 TaxID=282217 RepID=UPI0013185E30|nr:helix-turn-helix transcriptional regulator [Variovorax sp. SRS16]VTU25159.1 hypothetical protein SRS16CHR_03604 [Variovorax sp. SRS16]
MNNNEFDEAVAGFYKAATGSLRWVEALALFREAVSAFAVYLHAVDRTRDCVVFGYNASDMPAEAELDYIRTFHRIDPRARLLLQLEPGEWVHCWEHFDDDFVSKDRFYQDFLIPYGGRYVSAIQLVRDDSLSVILGVHRGLGSPRLDAGEIATCARLARHLADALDVQGKHLQLAQQGCVGIELLARLRAPVVLIDVQRRVRHANPAARALLARDDAIGKSGGRLRCHRPADDSGLSLALHRLLSTPDGDADAVDRIFLKARSASPGAVVGLYLYALRPKNILHAFGSETLAMLLIHESGSHLQLDPFLVAAAFDLTPAEARVAVATARGESPEQIARSHRISVFTVRAQLQVIFQKTRTARQQELISLLAALPMAALGLQA